MIIYDTKQMKPSSKMPLACYSRYAQRGTPTSPIDHISNKERCLQSHFYLIAEHSEMEKKKYIRV